MEPEQSNMPIPTLVRPPENGGSPAPQGPVHRFSRKITVVGALIVALIIAVVGVVLGLGHKSAPKPAGGGSFAMILQDNASPVKYGGDNVVQACNIFPQRDLARAGYTIDTGPGVGAFSRTYFTGGGTSNLILGRLGFTVIGGPYFNTCTTLLANGLSIWTTVLQPSYIASGSFTDYVAKQNPQALQAIDGVKISQFTPSDAQTTNYALISPDGQVGVDFYVESEIRGQNPAILEAARQALVKVAATNLVAQSKQATGPSTLTYGKSFPASYAKACSLTSNSDFKAIYGVDESPLVTENAGAPGTTGTASAGDASLYVDNECFIQSYVNEDDAILNPNPDFSPPDVQHLTIRTESYLTALAAQIGFNTVSHSAQGATPANGIGDQAFFATAGGGLNNPLIFRKGRFIIEIAPTQLGVPSGQSSQQIVQELTPLGKKVAREL